MDDQTNQGGAGQGMPQMPASPSGDQGGPNPGASIPGNPPVGQTEPNQQPAGQVPSGGIGQPSVPSEPTVPQPPMGVPGGAGQEPVAPGQVPGGNSDTSGGQPSV